jgi:hypothetical protein
MKKGLFFMCVIPKGGIEINALTSSHVFLCNFGKNMALERVYEGFG